MTGMRGRTGGLRVAGFVMAVVASGPALAQVTQTDSVKTPLPQPVGSAELSLIDDSWAWNANTMVNRDPQGALLIPPVNYGDYYAPPAYPQFVTGDAIKLSGLFKWRKEAIDPVLDAKTGPGYFSGKCGFNAELLLLGGNCQAEFGWYNVLDPASKTPPAATEIYPLMAAPQKALQCVQSDGTTAKLDGFCPLAWDNRDPYNLSILRWIPKVFGSGDVSLDSRYKGGNVAFALIGDPAKCPQNKYSMYEHNQRNSNGEPWVTSLIYQSKLDPNGFYIAFEDLPMSAADWKKRSDSLSTSGADGDFNDFVVYVSRVPCPDEVDAACVGKSCLSGQKCQLGACIDACSGVVCTGNTLCSNGACSSPSSGAGGSAGGGTLTFGGGPSTGTAGVVQGEAGEESAGGAFSGAAAGDGDDPGSAAGTDARGGASGGTAIPGSPGQKSSSCGYAPLAPGLPSRAWPALGLAFGLACLRRRRRERSRISSR